MEEWRDVVGSEDRYEVSSLGRVRAKARLLKPWNMSGYKAVSLGKSRKTSVHRLVCEAFHGPAPSEGLLVAHTDGSRDNNAATNLRWATYSENLADSIGHGTCRLPQYYRPLKGEQHGMAKLTDAQTEEIRAECPDGKARFEVAERYGISRNHLWRILRGRARK